MTIHPILTVIPARGGSKGLPGKNIKSFANLPLIAHSIKCAQMCSGLDRVIVSTDSEEIASIAKQHNGDVPFIRPSHLAQDETPMLAVLKHALTEMEKIDGKIYNSLLLLDPTSPGRVPSDIHQAAQKLEADETADGIIGVSEPDFNPYWHCMIERDGYMTPLIEGVNSYTRRQDVPPVYRINASLYIWRRSFLHSVEHNWMTGHFLMQEIPEQRAIHIDELEEFERAELLVNHGHIRFPWLETKS